jgi:hypothetical protein
MATDKKTSVLVKSSLPEFLDTEGPKFQAFVRAYYEWLETTNQITDRSKNLLEYTDIDRTQDEFIDWFRREILADFPKSVLADKKLLYQRILDLYKSKGSENAYKLLFRVLYDEEIEFYYPGQDILKVSDGRWTKETSIRLAAPFVGNLEEMGGENIVGVTSGATAKVLRVTSTLETGINVFELFLSSLSGTFKDNETVRNTSNTLSGLVISSTGPLQGVIIQFGGANHTNGDRVSFNSASGSGASGIVVGTTGQSISPAITDGGSGYRTGDSTTVTISGGDGSGAAFEVSAISNPETIQTYDDTISDLSGTRIDANTYITSNTGTISANLAIANSSTVLSAALGTSNTTVGTISAIRAITRGSNYTVAPGVSAIDREIFNLRLPDGSGGFKGSNAQLGAELVAGSLTNVLVDTFGSGYNRSDLITISNLTNPAAENAIAAPLVSGIIQYPGKYTDTKGFISWNNKLQDNYYYQEFSYSLRTTQTVDAYREIVKNVTHSAGTKLFGDHRISSNISLTLVSDSYTKLLLDNVGFQANTTFGVTGVSHIVAPTSIASTESFENDAVLLPTISPASITSTADVSDDDHIFVMEVGGASLISVPSALQFGTTTLGRVIDLSPIVSQESTLASATIQEYSANTVLQLQSETFNSLYSIPQVPEPTITTENNVFVNSIDSALSIGTLEVLPGTVNIDPNSITTTVQFGTTAVGSFTFVDINSVDSTLSFGTTEVLPGTVNIDLNSVDATLAFGTLELLPGTVNVDPNSVTTTVQFGNTTVGSFINVDPSSITSTLTFGTAELLRGDVYIDMSSIGSTLQLGDINVENLNYIDPESTTYSLVSTLVNASVGEYSSNTVSQLQTETFNSSYAASQVPKPDVG